jgi:hypothetical protein
MKCMYCNKEKEAYMTWWYMGGRMEYVCVDCHKSHLEDSELGINREDMVIEV